MSDGALALALGARPTRLHEVAPYIHRRDVGAAFSGAAAINRDTRDGLPEEVQNAMTGAGKYHTESHGPDLVDRHEFALNRVVDLGAGQGRPVRIIPMPPQERRNSVDLPPNLAAEGAGPLGERGIPASDFIRACLDGQRARNLMGASLPLVSEAGAMIAVPIVLIYIGMPFGIPI